MAKKGMYTVRISGKVQYFPPGYFPRKFHFKASAIRIAKQAIEHGASMARVEFPNMGELDFRPLPGRSR